MLTTQKITEAEYLKGELVSEFKHEYVDGALYAVNGAMTGASRNHDHIVQNIARHFGNHLFNSHCAPRGSDTKVKTPTGQYRYPDYLVVCEESDDDQHYVQSPVLIIEVISDSTRKTDQQTKRLEYINIASLEEYVLIEQDFVNIVVYRKSDDWRPTHYFLGETVTFESIELTLDVADVYHRVENNELVEWRKQAQ